MWLSWSIYRQIQQQKGLQQSWQTILATLQGPSQWRIYVVCVLMFFNLGFEAKKWQVLMQIIQPLSFWRSFRAVFSCEALASSTPNRVGEYVGRIVYLNDGNRLRALSLSAVGSFGQIIITFLMGLLGIIFIYTSIVGRLQEAFTLSRFWINWLIYLVSITVLVQLALYYNLSWITRLLEKIPLVAKYSFFIQKLEDLHNKELTKILFLSFIRYVVYIVQYLLMFQLFGVEVAWWQIICLVCVQLMIMSVVPVIALAELGIRGQLSLALFSLFSKNTIGIIAAVSGIWLINLIVPALAGSLLILGIRIFRK